MSMRLFVVIILGVTVAGCSTMELPGGQTASYSDVCGELSGRKCAPSTGEYLLLTKSRKILEIDEKGKPLLTSYLGSVVTQQNRLLGEPGAFCSSAASVAFDYSDIAEATFSNSISINYTIASVYGGSVEADIAEAIEAANIPTEVSETISGDINAVAAKISSQKISADLKFQEYRIKNEVLRSLDAGGGDNLILKSCYEKLKTGNFRLYVALTGFDVQARSVNSTEIVALLASLSAKLRGQTDDDKVLAFEAALGQITNKVIKTSTDRYFVVTALSLWRSPSGFETIRG